MKKVLWSLLASCALSSAAFAGPTGPAGEGVDYQLARTITIPADQAFQVAIRYNANKEVRGQIWYSDNDSNYNTNSNTYVGNGPHLFITERQGYPRDLIITGWSKNCRSGEKKCARTPWTQEPYTIFEQGRTIGFEDSYDGPYTPGTYNDIQVTITCLNDKAACPI